MVLQNWTPSAMMHMLPPQRCPFVAHFPFNRASSLPRPAFLPLCTTAAKEDVETNQIESAFVDIGYVCSVHGLQGEVRVKPTTGFPELRFSKPGKRWLKQQLSGREMIQEIQLVEGRSHPGQPSWIVKFDDIDSADEALRLIGSIIMVTDQDRPELDEGEFYTNDLVGMAVILKETGKSLGTVVSVFNSGASDLLRVRLNSSVDKPITREGEVDNEAPLLWIPFVEEIVPDVDVNKREMQITPPEGLLELNIRPHEKPKKERRLLEWKEKKKFQKHVIAAKKKLCELEQLHVFDGFGHGDKSQARLLAEQIVSVNSKLLQQALQMHTVSTTSSKDVLKAVEKSFQTRIRQQSDVYSTLQEKGISLTSHGKVATIVVLEDNNEPESLFGHLPSDTVQDDTTNCSYVEALFFEDEGLAKTEILRFVPMILVSPPHTTKFLQELFSNNDYFSFNSDKVWFLEEEKLPLVSYSLEDPKRHRILMKSPWEILQKPIGSGGVISLLSSNKLLDDLSTQGVEYIKVCKNGFRNENGEALIGLLDSHKGSVGIEVFKDLDQSEKESIHMVFSMRFMKKLVKQIKKLEIEAIAVANRYTEKVEKEWVNVVPSSSPNSIVFCSSIYSCLKSCPSNEIHVLEVHE